MSQIKTGRYRHYKGREYLVLCEATNSETLERMVIYKALYDFSDSADICENGVWARPVDMFSDNVTVNGESVPRFEFIGE